MGRWVLLDVIYREVKFDRDLLKWCKEQNKKGLVTNIDDGIRNQAININNNYEMIDPLTFKSEADTFLLAFAKINGLGIFSRESKRTKERDLYKIPDVCDIFKIRHTSKPKVFLKEIGFN